MVRVVFLDLYLHNCGYVLITIYNHYIFVTKLETHLFFLKIGNYPTLCFVMAPQSLRWPFSMFLYLFKRRQSLLITTNHRIVSASEIPPLTL